MVLVDGMSSTGFCQSCEAVHKLLQLFLQARCVHVTGTTRVSTYFLHQGGRCMTLRRITAITLSSEAPAPPGIAQKMLYSFAVDPHVRLTGISIWHWSI
jgi:hypothetical protein